MGGGACDVPAMRGWRTNHRSGQHRFHGVRRHGRRSLAIVLTLVAVILSACAGSAATPVPTDPPASAVPSAAATAGPTDSTSEPVAGTPESPAAGVVIGVTSNGSQVTGFTLRTSDGTTVDFTIGQLENADEFPADELTDHEGSVAPILVFFRSENGKLVVFRLEDAG